jgi:hypothetical protein
VTQGHRRPLRIAHLKTSQRPIPVRRFLKRIEVEQMDADCSVDKRQRSPPLPRAAVGGLRCACPPYDLRPATAPRPATIRRRANLGYNRPRT